jgi:hypothetical protein
MEIRPPKVIVFSVAGGRAAAIITAGAFHGAAMQSGQPPRDGKVECPYTGCVPKFDKNKRVSLEMVLRDGDAAAEAARH